MEKFLLERPVLAVDVVMFGMDEGRLKVLLCQRDKEPFKGAPSLPGVAVRVDETLEMAARRALSEKTGWTNSPDHSESFPEPFMEQLATFDALYRDPRGRTVSVAYLGITRTLEENLDDVRWQAADEITEKHLPFDHFQIIETALNRLQGKLRYTNIAGAFMPESFRIEALQSVYESILGIPLNRSNFRGKLMKIGLIEQVTVLTDAVGKKGGRPPHLYRFRGDLIESADRDFL